MPPGWGPGPGGKPARAGFWRGPEDVQQLLESLLGGQALRRIGGDQHRQDAPEDSLDGRHPIVQEDGSLAGEHRQELAARLGHAAGHQRGQGQLLEDHPVLGLSFIEQVLAHASDRHVKDAQGIMLVGIEWALAGVGRGGRPALARRTRRFARGADGSSATRPGHGDAPRRRASCETGPRSPDDSPGCPVRTSSGRIPERRRQPDPRRRIASRRGPSESARIGAEEGPRTGRTPTVELEHGKVLKRSGPSPSSSVGNDGVRMRHLSSQTSQSPPTCWISSKAHRLSRTSAPGRTQAGSDAMRMENASRRGRGSRRSSPDRPWRRPRQSKSPIRCNPATPAGPVWRRANACRWPSARECRPSRWTPGGRWRTMTLDFNAPEALAAYDRKSFEHQFLRENGPSGRCA